MDYTVSLCVEAILSFLTSASRQQALRYLATLEARNYASSTVLAVARTLKSLTDRVSDSRQAALIADFSQATSQDITDFVTAARKAGLAASTINTKLSMLGEFFEFLREDGLMNHQPVLRRRHRLLAPLTLPKPINQTDLAAFFKVVDSVRDRLIFLLMLRCGLRVSEVCALTWAVIDFNDGTARINNGKGQVDRIAYLSPDVEQGLRTWRASRQQIGQYLFPSRSRKGLPLTRYQINFLMDEYLKVASITKHYSPHCLRHTFATEMLNAGVSLEVLKELMGHRSIQVTLRYTQLYDTTKREQYDQAMAKIEKRQAIGGR
ncbi:MAG: tyrosine-type recombinase/integrase [Blastocatellia bacterium]